MKKFLLPFQNMVRADLFSGYLAVWNFFGGAAHFCPVTSEPRKARRGNSVRAILRIHRQLEFFKPEEAASLRSAANLYSFLGENEKLLSIKAKEIF
ncbi:MAG: hypothetical protein HYW65_04765 [Candidatus Liptonbacteria bacterium]|nr:hypothetical protein [Candidatus Liptonbacteria bacterium]